MMMLARLCLDWRVVGALVMLAAAIWVAAPNALYAALPLLAAIACPLVMLLGLWGMVTGRRASRPVANDETVPRG